MLGDTLSDMVRDAQEELARIREDGDRGYSDEVLTRIAAGLCELDAARAQLDAEGLAAPRADETREARCTCAEMGATGMNQRHALCPAHADVSVVGDSPSYVPRRLT